MTAPPPSALPLSVWTDLYGAAHARFEGRAGSHAWLVAAPISQAAAAAQALETFMADAGGRLRGHAELLIHGSLLPLETALKTGHFSGAVVVGTALGAGPAVRLPLQTHVTPAGLSYVEGGEFPAWQAAFALSGAAGLGEQAAASVCAQQGVPVLVCGPLQLAEALLGLAGRAAQGLTGG